MQEEQLRRGEAGPRGLEDEGNDYDINDDDDDNVDAEGAGEEAPGQEGGPG